MNARRRHLRAAACLTLVGLLACLPLAAAFGSVNEDDMVLRLSAAERALLMKYVWNIFWRIRNSFCRSRWQRQ